jgi:hypothetical protein
MTDGRAAPLQPRVERHQENRPSNRALRSRGVRHPTTLGRGEHAAFGLELRPALIGAAVNDLARLRRPTAPRNRSDAVASIRANFPPHWARRDIDWTFLDTPA